MALRTILTYPDPLLQRVAEPVEKFDAALGELAADMIETMRAAPGIGLAAPQVGVPIRLIVVEIPAEKEEGTAGAPPPPLYVVCNPALTKTEGAARIEEGCLSVPGLFVEVDRAARVTVEGQGPGGAPFRLETEGLTAICFQHEIDHLDGKLLVNYLSSVKRDLYRREARKLRKESAANARARRNL